MIPIVVQPEVIKALADCIVDVIQNKIDWNSIDWQAVAENQRKNDWIPVSERLPNRNGVYNVTRKLKEGEIYDIDYSRWIPIKMRPGTDEEYEEFSQYGDCPREDFRIFDSPMPDDDQEVLVTTRWGEVCKDIWHRDVDCCYFEDNSDDDDVIAWMPLPEPYKKGGAE